ncbi:hypothetical protein V8C34DRAFT_276485 [Trichoderma compactum]
MHRQYCPCPIPAPATSSTMQLHPRNCPERSRSTLLQMPQENRVHVQEMSTGLCPNPLSFFFSRHPGLGEARGSPHRTAIGYPMPRFPDFISLSAAATKVLVVLRRAVALMQAEQ